VAQRGTTGADEGQRTETAETRVTGPRPRPGEAARSRGSIASSGVANPADAMRLDELQRTRVFAAFALCLITAVALVLPQLGGDPLAKKVHFGGLAIGFAASALTLALVRRDRPYRPAVVMLFGYCCAIAVATGYVFWGVHSAVMLLVPIGIYFFALGESLSTAVSTLVVALAPHAALSIAFLLGWAHDRGIVRPFSNQTQDMVGVSFLVEFICVAAFVMARSLRRSNLHAMEQLDRAVREVAHREALLDEARQELERALVIGGPGRYTGTTLGSFRLGNLLGRGAMGDVYEAEKVETGTPAAVKLLHTTARADPELVARFLRELRMASSLRAPNVVAVLEVASPDMPVPYLAMERLEGKSLAHILRDRRRLPPAEVAELVAALAAGLEVAHEAGIVHRDLKPQNVFLHQPAGAYGLWKILDFGVSTLVDDGGTLTRGQVIGTPAYMAPEQARGQRVDRRADLYGLGAIAYRALVGRPPFAGADVPAILHAVVYAEPPRPSRAARLPAVFDQVLAIALAKEPDDRFQSPGELAAAFTDAARGHLDRSLRRRAEQLMPPEPGSH
jgi:eukaryotic-like serine/threonine-protein kinase